MFGVFWLMMEDIFRTPLMLRVEGGSKDHQDVNAKEEFPGLGMRTVIHVSPIRSCSSNINNNKNVVKGYESCNVYYISGQGKELLLDFYIPVVFFPSLHVFHFLVLWFQPFECYLAPSR